MSILIQLFLNDLHIFPEHLKTLSSGKALQRLQLKLNFFLLIMLWKGESRHALLVTQGMGECHRELMNLHCFANGPAYTGRPFDAGL